MDLPRWPAYWPAKLHAPLPPVRLAQSSCAASPAQTKQTKVGDKVGIEETEQKNSLHRRFLQSEHTDQRYVALRSCTHDCIWLRDCTTACLRDCVTAHDCMPACACANIRNRRHRLTCMVRSIRSRRDITALAGIMLAVSPPAREASLMAAGAPPMARCGSGVDSVRTLGVVRAGETVGEDGCRDFRRPRLASSGLAGESSTCVATAQNI